MMKKDSEYLDYFEKGRPAPVIKVGVPTQPDLSQVQHSQLANPNHRKAESESISSTLSLREKGFCKTKIEPVILSHASHEEGLSKVEAEPVASPPVSHSRHLYRVCKTGASRVTHSLLEGGRFVYRGGKVEVHMPLVPKMYNPMEDKSVKTPQQIVTAVPSPPPSYLILKDLVTPTTIGTILLMVAIARQPVQIAREVVNQFSLVYRTLREMAPPAHLRKLRQLVDADRFVDNRATFVVSSLVGVGKENKRRRADILIYKTGICAPTQQLERGSIYVANKRIANTSILQCMYGKVVRTGKVAKGSEFASCELAFDLSLSPCFKFKPSSSVARWCYMSPDVAKRLGCDFAGVDELMRRGEI